MNAGRGGNTETTILHARLRVPFVSPISIWQALTDPARMVRWFQRHQSELGAADGLGQDAWFRGAYHFWSFFTPHAPPDPQHTLLEAHWPTPADDRVKLRYGWKFRGHTSSVTLVLEPLRDGSYVTVTHRGMPAQLPGLGSGRAYWTLVLENMRLYLLGRDGLRFHETLGPGELGLSTELITPAGLDATAAAWELLTGAGSMSGLPLPGTAVRSEPPHGDGAGGTAARLDLQWQHDALGLPGVLSWRLAGSGARTRITIVQSGFAQPLAEQEGAQWLADWRGVLGQLRGQLDLGEDWTQVELE